MKLIPLRYQDNPAEIADLAPTDRIDRTTWRRWPRVA